MTNITVIGIDLAKNVIQIHGENKEGKVVLKKRVARESFLKTMREIPPCLVGMEACGGSNYWAGELKKLQFDVRLIHPKRVQKFVDTHKNDARDAEACAEAVRHSKTKFVPVKTRKQFEIQRLHRARSLSVREKTGLMNMLRGFLLELGIAIPRGEAHLYKRLTALLSSKKEDSEQYFTEEDKIFFLPFEKKLKTIDEELKRYDEELKELAKTDQSSRLLQTIEGIGPVTATALTAKIGNGDAFHKGRELSAYLGLVPKQCSSGETYRLLGITKHGDRYIRQLLVHGGRSVVNAALRINKKTGAYYKQDAHSEWARSLVERVGWNKASVAVANKNARIALKVLKTGIPYSAEMAHGISTMD